MKKHGKVFLLLLSQTLQGIKRQAVESRIFNQFKRLNYSQSLAKAKEEEQNAFAQECIQLASLATSVILVIIGSLWVLNGELTTGGLAACSILSGRAVAPLSALIGVRIKLNTIHSANQAIEKLEHLPADEALPSLSSNVESVNVSGFSSVRYGKAYRLDFSATKGDLIQITSQDRHIDGYLSAMLAGVDQPDSGEIKVNDKIHRSATLQSYSAYCGVKGQLVAGTLLDNLCGFNSDAIDRANHYAQALGLSNHITRLPEGLETKIGHASSSPLSMGNIKLLNIAAQLASMNPIVVLDKPDASLDLDGLDKLGRVLMSEMESGRIILLVSHHPILQQLATKTIQVEVIVVKEVAA